MKSLEVENVIKGGAGLTQGKLEKENLLPAFIFYTRIRTHNNYKYCI